MNSFSTSDFLREAETQQAFYKEQISKFDAVLADQASHIAALAKKKEAALSAMTEIFLPAFTAENCAALAQRLQKQSLARLFSEFLSEKQQLQERIQTIEHNERFQKYDALTNPQSGVLTTQIAELEPLLAEAEAAIKKLHSLQGFERLLANRYGRSDYVHQGMMRFLTPEYYADNSDAAVIMKHFGVDDFLDVLSVYNTSQDRVRTLAPSLQGLRAEYASLRALADEYTRTAQRLATLESVYKRRVQDAIEEYCAMNDKQTIGQLFAASAASDADVLARLESAFKQFDGVEHQVEYLQALQAKVTDERYALVQKSTALSDEMRRYSADPHRFRNKRWTGDQFARKFKRDGDRYNRSIYRYSRTGTTIYVFDDYDRVSPFEEFLWWDVMSDGRLDGNFIPEVQEFYESHPDYEYNSADYAPSEGVDASYDADNS